MYQSESTDKKSLESIAEIHKFNVWSSLKIRNFFLDDLRRERRVSTFCDYQIIQDKPFQDVKRFTIRVSLGGG